MALVRAKVTLCLVPQVIYEFWVAATRPVEVNGLGMDVPLAQHSIEGLLQDFVLLKDERGIFGNWQSLVIANAVKGKGAHDARLVRIRQLRRIANPYDEHFLRQVVGREDGERASRSHPPSRA